MVPFWSLTFLHAAAARICSDCCVLMHVRTIFIGREHSHPGYFKYRWKKKKVLMFEEAKCCIWIAIGASQSSAEAFPAVGHVDGSFLFLRVSWFPHQSAVLHTGIEPYAQVCSPPHLFPLRFRASPPSRSPSPRSLSWHRNEGKKGAESPNMNRF